MMRILPTSLRLALVCGWMLPAVAAAHHIEDLKLESTEEGVSLVLRSSQADLTPRMHALEGSVRLWFIDMQGVRPRDLPGDGQVIRSISLRPGSEQTAVVRIELTDAKRIVLPEVHVQSGEGVVRIHIARPATAKTAAPPPTAPEPEVATASPAPARVLPPAKPRAPLVTASAIPAALDGRWRVRWMALLCVPLLGLLVLLRWLHRRQPSPAKTPSIQVLANKRLAPRHQLVVVRALGRDHLLSIQAGQTQRLASTASDDGLSADGLAADGLPTETPAAAMHHPQGAKGRFGAHLFHLMAQANHGSPAAPVDKANPSAIEGLLRLREEKRASRV